MTPLPKRRWSTRRQGKRRATLAPSGQTMVKCANCGQLTPSHSVCLACGFYRGKQVIRAKSKIENVN